MNINKIILWVLLGITMIGCNRKIAPTIIYQDKIVTRIDTVKVISKETDTIPCDDFAYYLTDEIHDTVYVKVIDKQLSVKYINKRDTIFRETIIVQPAPLRSVTKIDNSIKNKAKNGSAIGDGNTITTKKTNWWWIFFAGMASWFIIQNVVWRFIKNSNPVTKILSLFT